jgi:hypothetical protein
MHMSQKLSIKQSILLRNAQLTLQAADGLLVHVVVASTVLLVQLLSYYCCYCLLQLLSQYRRSVRPPAAVPLVLLHAVV